MIAADFAVRLLSIVVDEFDQARGEVDRHQRASTDFSRVLPSCGCQLITVSNVAPLAIITMPKGLL